MESAVGDILSTPLHGRLDRGVVNHMLFKNRRINVERSLQRASSSLEGHRAVFSDLQRISAATVDGRHSHYLTLRSAQILPYTPSTHLGEDHETLIRARHISRVARLSNALNHA